MLKKGFKFLILSFFLTIILASNAFAFESVKFAIREICGHMQGNLGGLLMTVAGVGGLTAAAFGNLRASHSMIVTGIGAAAISTVLSLYFPAAAKECDGGGGAPAAKQAVAKTAPFEVDTQTGKAFDEAALKIAQGQEANLNNNVELQAVDEDVDFDPGADDVAEGF